jgi:hypothetical protein
MTSVYDCLSSVSGLKNVFQNLASNTDKTKPVFLAGAEDNVDSDGKQLLSKAAAKRLREMMSHVGTYWQTRRQIIGVVEGRRETSFF